MITNYFKQTWKFETSRELEAVIDWINNQIRYQRHKSRKKPHLLDYIEWLRRKRRLYTKQLRILNYAK